MRKVLLLLVFLSLFACRKDLETVRGGSEGEISFGLFATSETNVTKEESAPEEGEEGIDTKSFAVRIENTRGETLKSWEIGRAHV